MPPQALFDISGVDLNRVLYGQDEIRKYNPHRPPFEMLEGINWVDTETDRIVGFKDIRDDEFWVPGHIPGRPLFPGVLMIELAGQLASFYTKKIMGWKGFVGFGGVQECKFRMQVTPGMRLNVLAVKQWERHHRISCKTQGLVDGQIAFETDIIGIEF
jgi:3-hydroxyacyl-[acyl-carrier-protein] dehydratase